MKKIIVFGSKGLLGEACCRILAENGEIIAVSRNELELTETAAISEYLENTDYDVIINAAAVTSLEACLDQPVTAQLVNVEAAAAMARCAERDGAKLVQISTDYVFSGEDDLLCDETMLAEPLSIYGKTKLEGEQRVLASDPSALVARVSWIFGKGRESFVDQLIAAALAGKKKPCIGDKFSIPNYADDLARGIWKLVEKDAAGVIHLCCEAEPESWYSYGEKTLEMAVQAGLIAERHGILERQYLAEAHFFREPRPKHTAMRSSRLKQEFDLEIRHWHEGLEDFLKSF